MRLVAAVKPKTVLEIGTANGGTLFLLSRMVAGDATLISIDLRGGACGGGYATWRIPIYKSFALPGQNLSLIRGDSHTRKTFDALHARLGDKQLDLLFIDGDHTYEGVKQDFETYSPLVAPGGVIAFHDVVQHTRITSCTVDQFWKEIRDQYEHHEIVEDPAQGWGGIGVLKVR
jgi:predicted O-methyltransferase YrrM